MLRLALVLAFAGDPNADALPHWEAAPEPSEASEPSEPPKAKVPADGSGMITLGSLLLGSGAITGTTALVTWQRPDLAPTAWPGLGGIFGAVQLGAGSVVLALGLVVRRQFRARAAIPGAPRTGGGMLLGGLGLMLGGTAYAAQALVDMTSEICGGGEGCRDIRPIGAPIQLGASLASIVVGTTLFTLGVRRRIGYLRWEQNRLQPTFTAAPGAIGFGVAGRF